MTRTRSLATSLLSLSAAALLALTTAGGATAAPSASGDKEQPSVTSAAVDSTGAADYWTADRMRSAIPGDVLAGKALERGNTSSAATVEKGANTKVRAGKGKPTIAVSENPVDHIGKVFFTLAGTNYVCSGNAVVSANKSTVATAGHCLNEGPGAFATNFIFVPAYENGAAPYGKWTAKALYAPTQWSSYGDMQYDTGFAVMNTAQRQVPVRRCERIRRRVQRGPRPDLQVLRLPRGVALQRCDPQELLRHGVTTIPTTRQFLTQGIPCDMTGGSSGGPWFIGSSAAGLQNSINSYGYSGSPVMYGPYWGTVIQQTYTSAAAS